ncbi:class I tRNA ligase family protein, partial [uncultured Corynebacterium sp.]
NGEEVKQEYGKMGKSLKNAVAPDDIAQEFGADTLRVYEMSMGPLDTSRPWATKDVVGAHRFLQRLWRLIVNEETGEVTVSDEPMSDEDAKQLHRTIAGVRDDYEHLRDNTVVAKLIEYVNYLTKAREQKDGGDVSRETVEPLVQMVSPVAPHIAEELWARLGHEGTITFEPFPTFDEGLLVDDTVEVPVQINGKVRARVDVPTEASKDEIESIALADDRVAGLIEGKNVVKTIVVPGRMVNLVVK